jgi:hypothetical protein
MKKRNTRNTPTEQERKLAAKNRRERRKAKLAAMIMSKIRPLVIENGRLKQQLKTMEIKEKKEVPSEA